MKSDDTIPMSDALKSLQELSRKREENGEPPFSSEFLKRVTEIIENLPVEPEVYSLNKKNSVTLEYVYDGFDYLGVEILESEDTIILWDTFGDSERIHTENLNDAVLKFHGEERMTAIRNITNNPTEEECLEAVRRMPELLHFIKNQTEKVCLEAVRNDPYGTVLRFVQNQTPEICMESVKRCGGSLYYVREQTPEICRAAILNEPNSLGAVRNRTPELCELAISQNGIVIEHVPKELQTLELSLKAVKNTPYALKYVRPCFRKACEEWLKTRNQEE